MNKFEKIKREKDGLAVKNQLDEFARIGWKAIDETDLNHRLKWLGLFFRSVTPGKFMLRLLEKFSVNPTPLVRSLVSCTGAQFCSFALVETKNRAIALVKELEAELDIPRSVRMHWTGCPNSCGQPQVAEIGLMGTKVCKNGKTVEGVDIYMGGKVGKDAQLGTCVTKGIACEDLKPFLENLLIENFGAKKKG